jgi:multiple sugar transport system permease protein
MLKQRSSILKSLVKGIALVAVILFFIAPIYWMLSTAFKPMNDQVTYPPLVLPTQFYLGNLYSALFVKGGAKAVLDSFVIASTNTILAVLIGGLAAYAVSRWRVGGPNVTFFILSIRFSPAVAFVIPFYILFTTLHLTDTWVVLIIAYFTFNLPFAMWMMKGFFDDISTDLDESGLIDNYTPLQVFWKLILPVARPGMIATGLMCFIFSWNEFMLALFLTRVAVTPLPTLIPRFYGGQTILYGEVCGIALVASIPVIVLALLLQRYLVRGLSLGAVK